MVRRLAVLLVSALSLAGLSLSPAAANPDHSTTYYLALGDSLAAGFQPGANLDRTQGYVWRLHDALTVMPAASLASLDRSDATQDRKLRLNNVGCDGATTTSLLRGGGCTYPGRASQLEAAERFLHAHKSRVSLVTIDIGGNDINACVRGGVIDEACVPPALATLAGNLGQIVARLRAAAGPHTRIVGMTYYNPYLYAWLGGPAGQQLALRSRQLAAVINGLLAGTYAAGGVSVADVAAAFASNDLSTLVPLPGVGPVPLGVARICQWTWMCAPAPIGPDIHANTAGYAVIAQVFLAELAA